MCGYITTQYDEDATPSVVCYVTIYLFVYLFIYLFMYCGFYPLIFTFWYYIPPSPSSY